MAARSSWQSLKTKPVILSAVTVASIGAYYGTRSHLLPTAYAESAEPPKMFKGFGFTTLRVQDVQVVNHNTKRLVFEFPDQNAKSGLSLTCTTPSIPWLIVLSLTIIAALLTFSWPRGRWLPVLRPYTPISELGTITLLYISTSHLKNHTNQDKPKINKAPSS